MREPRDGVRLAQKALAKGGVLYEVSANDFDRYLAAKRAELPGAIDFCHATCANAFKQFVCAQARALRASHKNQPLYQKKS
jgi:hypothetical protein